MALVQKAEHSGRVMAELHGCFGHRKRAERDECHRPLDGHVLSLVWGVRAFYYSGSVTTDETIRELQNILKEKGFVNTDDIIINLASIPLDEQGRTNMIKLGRVV